MNRREALRNLGLASAAGILWACGPKQVQRAAVVEADVSQSVRGWLRDAVARLALAYPGVHALAVQRRRIAAAVDVIGAGVTRTRDDAVVLTVRDGAGHAREQVTSELSATGVDRAVRALLGPTAPATAKKAIDFGPEAARRGKLAGVDPRRLDDKALRQRAEAMLAGERSSRIVYAAGLVEIDDATVWSVAPGRDLEQRRVRVRRTATRVAWSGTRPVVSEVALGWAGGVDDQAVSLAQLDEASRGALEIMTPAAFADGEYAVVLEPGVAASAIDAVARGLLTTTAMRRPEVARRLAPDARVAAPAITLVDDPGAPAAYGGFAFDDAGVPAAPVALVERGLATGKLGSDAAPRTRRPGHSGRAEVAPSHLRLAAGERTWEQLVGDGFVLEGARGTTLDPSSGRIGIAAARARELKGGQRTGRVFADVELVGDLTVLGTITGVSRETAVVAYRDEVDGGLPRFRSIHTPWIAARGFVRGRGGAA